ncbi:MAG: PQQ-binding-like beta-propeller repeat protein [Planctomycetales bacterium]|nr:PQQ-binding-like beta-propeller repeat protein [Planctomycetales bacterium]
MGEPNKLYRICVLLLLAVFASNTRAESNWNQFRGAEGSGVSASFPTPQRWNQVDGIRWTARITGCGQSSPVVQRDRVDITSVDNHGQLKICSYDRSTGELRHQIHVGASEIAASENTSLGQTANLAVPTPIADGDLTWAHFGDGTLACANVASNTIVWVQRRPEETAPGSNVIITHSPRMIDGKLFLTSADSATYRLLSLDAATGKLLWRQVGRMPDKLSPAVDVCSTPVVLANQHHSKRNPVSLVASIANRTFALDLHDATVAWRSSDALRTELWQTSATPVVASDMIVSLPNFEAKPSNSVVAWKRSNANDLTFTLSWEHHSRLIHSAPVMVDHLIFLVTVDGIMTCLDAGTGRVFWQKRLPDSDYQASLVAGGGYVYALSSTGTCCVIKATATFELISINRLPGSFVATPAIDDGVLYLRSDERLYAIDGR